MLAVLLEDAIRLQCCLSGQGAGQPRCVFISNRDKGWIFFFFAEVPAEFSFMFQVLKWNLALK